MVKEITYRPGTIRSFGNYDLVVAGGGPAGIGAALAARRSGLSVLLVEAQSQLGGMGTAGLVSHWLGGRTNDCTDWVVGGIFRELSEVAGRRGIALLPKPEPGKGFAPFGWNSEKGGQLTAGVPFDPCEMAALLDEMMLDAGVELLYATSVIDAIVDGDRITHLVVFNKSGLQALGAPMFVDATGDADLACRSGCETALGREEDRLMAPVTLQVHMDHIDQDALAAYINRSGSTRFLPEIEELRKEGKWHFAYDRFISVQLTEKGTMMVNTPRITGIDGTDGASVTKGIIQGRKEIYELREVMRRHIPGCANVRVRAIAPALGVRETRRIVGEYELTVEDLIRGEEFPDTVAFTAYGWDLPDPIKPSFNPSGGDRKRPVTPIPYRIMLPRPIANLICPGRAVSVERAVLGPLRVQAPCMGMGEAAGVAASIAAGAGGSFHTIDVAALREELKRRGAVVDYRQAWG